MKNKSRHFYQWQSFLMSFGTKIFLTICTPIMLFLVLLFCYNFSTVSEELASRYMMATKGEVESLLTTFGSIQSNFALDADLQKYLVSSHQDLQSAESYATKFDNDTTTFCASNSAISSIYLYRCSDDYVLAAGNNPPTNNYAHYFTDRNYIQSDMQQSLFLVRKASLRNGNATVLTCNFPIYYNAFLAGFLSINVDIHALQEDILQILPQESQVDILYDGQPLIHFPLDAASALGELGYSANFFNGKISISDDIKGQNLMVALRYNQNYSATNILANSKLFLLLILFLILFCFLLSYILTSRYYRAMVAIILKSTMPLDWYGAITSADDNRLHLSGNNQKIESELNERLASFRNLQFKFLQTQISPHFLFNSLNIISMMDLETFKQQSEIGKTTRLLSDILRYSITGDDFMTSFAGDLEYSLKYLELQNKRYANKIHYTCDIAPDVPEVRIIKFTLQPIVENAVHYAVADRDSVEIHITADIADERLVIDVSNNGAVMDAEKLAALNETLAAGKLNPEHTSGLLNVNKRIKLLYGESYGCRILQADSITHLMIEMPAKQGER